MDQASLLLRKQLKGRQALLHDNQVLHDLKSLRHVRTTPHSRPFDTELSKRPVEGFSAGLVDDSSLFEWAVTIMGPPDTL